MKNIWSDWVYDRSALSGPMIVAGEFGGFHPRQFMLFAFGELAGTNQRYFPSAKRMNVNSRGCQPAGSRRKTNPTPKGSHNALFRPFRAGLFVYHCSVGFTHGYSCCSPPANRKARGTTNNLRFARWFDTLRLCVFAPLR